MPEKTLKESEVDLLLNLVKREQVTLKIKKLFPEKDKDIPIPKYMSEEAAGIDLYTNIEKSVVIPPKEIKFLPCGIAIEIPKGYEAQIRPRSGLALKYGLTIVNSPGTVDSDYRGEIKIILCNLGNEEIKIERGDRIAQMVICPVVQANVIEVEELNSSKRNTNGWGSSGIK